MESSSISARDTNLPLRDPQGIRVRLDSLSWDGGKVTSPGAIQSLPQQTLTREAKEDGEGHRRLCIKSMNLSARPGACGLRQVKIHRAKGCDAVACIFEYARSTALNK